MVGCPSAGENIVSRWSSGHRLNEEGTGDQQSLAKGKDEVEQCHRLDGNERQGGAMPPDRQEETTENRRYCLVGKREGAS